MTSLLSNIFTIDSYNTESGSIDSGNTCSYIQTDRDSNGQIQVK